MKAILLFVVAYIFELCKALLGLAFAIFLFVFALPSILVGYAAGFVFRGLYFGWYLVNKHLDKHAGENREGRYRFPGPEE